MTVVQWIAKLLILFVALSAQAQTLGGPDQSALRSNRVSPNKRYEWVLDTSDNVRYTLLDLEKGKAVIASVDDYFATADKEFAEQHGSKFLAFWNESGNLVVLDEFNYRRAGELYAFFVWNGRADPLKLPIGELNIPGKGEAKPDEFRLTAQPESSAAPKSFGWVSDAVFQARLAVKLTDGSFESLPCTIDFSNRERPGLKIGGTE
jgi:hypothetical protein